MDSTCDFQSLDVSSNGGAEVLPEPLFLSLVKQEALVQILQGIGGL